MEIANTSGKPTLSTCSLSHGFNPAATLTRFICRAMTALSALLLLAFLLYSVSYRCSIGERSLSQGGFLPWWPLDFVLTYLADSKKRKRIETSSSRWEVDRAIKYLSSRYRNISFERLKERSYLHWLQTLVSRVHEKVEGMQNYVKYSKWIS